jgi:hypothetical protein
MYFSKEEIGEFEYHTNGLLYDKYRYALTNDLRPYSEYSGDNTDTLLSIDGTSIPYTEISKEMDVQSIAISNLPLESNNSGSYINWVTTDSELMDNSSLSVSKVQSFSYKVVNDWLFKIVLDNGFEWNDAFFTKLLVKKAGDDVIKFTSVENLGIDDTIYFWDTSTNEYVANIITSINPTWVENQILYSIDISPNYIYLTSAYDTIKFVQHNFIGLDDCSCCFSFGYNNCGMDLCCQNFCSQCSKQIN